MGEQVIVVSAHDEGLSKFTAADCRRWVGRSYPITDLQGTQIAEGRITDAELMDRFGQRARVHVEVPDLLVAGGLDTDRGHVAGVLR